MTEPVATASRMMETAAWPRSLMPPKPSTDTAISTPPPAIRRPTLSSAWRPPCAWSTPAVQRSRHSANSITLKSQATIQGERLLRDQVMKMKTAAPIRLSCERLFWLRNSSMKRSWMNAFTICSLSSVLVDEACVPIFCPPWRAVPGGRAHARSTLSACPGRDIKAYPDGPPCRDPPGAHSRTSVKAAAPPSTANRPRLQNS